MKHSLEVERAGLNLIKPYYSVEMALERNVLKSAMVEKREYNSGAGAKCDLRKGKIYEVRSATR